MGWSERTPTEEGFYWYKAPSWKDAMVVGVCRRCDKPEGPLTVFIGRVMMPLLECPGLWSQKIEEPE